MNMNMEGGESAANSSGGGESGTTTPAAASMSMRWNPTKEQINVLESLYGEGVRTPSAEQIQQITARLKAFGHIEGKNVFYWFQNHKARQRQKQKQESMSMACFNRYHLYNYKPSAHFPPPPTPNVVCSPYNYQRPQNELSGFYPQYQKVLLPAAGTIKTRPSPSPDTIEKLMPYGYDSAHLAYNTTTTIGNHKQETLPLFPVEPTGVLQARTASSSLSTTPSSSSDTTTGVDEGSGDQQHFFDFFSGNYGCCESD